MSKYKDVQPPQIDRQLVLDIASLVRAVDDAGVEHDRGAVDRLCRWNLYAATWLERIEREGL